MNLKPQDVVVLLKLVAVGQFQNYRLLAKDLFMSLSEVHQSMERAHIAQLLDSQKQMPRMRALEEFLLHGVKYAFPAQRGQIVRGVPTGYAAPPLNKEIVKSEDYPPVWPYAEGKTRGYSLEPLYKTVPKAALVDQQLYELLALLDAIREGRARERSLAADALTDRLREKRAPASNKS